MDTYIYKVVIAGRILHTWSQEGKKPSNFKGKVAPFQNRNIGKDTRGESIYLVTEEVKEKIEGEEEENETD